MIRNRLTIATLPRTQRGNPLVLGGDPKGKTFLYTNGNSVIIRDIKNPEISDIYTEHSHQTTVAKYSPSGFYICSGDVTGKVRIWDTTQKEHILKAEYQPFIGLIKDIAWSHDSQRLVVVGEGREKFGHVFSMDTGTSVGEIIGHSKQINSCDFRPKRPFKIITGSDDNFVGIYEGPPFKFKNQLNDHQKYVQSVRYSSNGDLFASGGFDGKLCIFKNDANEKIGEFNEHNGGIYGICWPSNSQESNKVITCSGDKTTKLFDINTMKCIKTWKFGSDLNDQQVSCLWQNDYILSVSLSGFINYLDERQDNIVKTIKGQNKPITAFTINDDIIYTGSCDGQIFYYNINTNEGNTTKESHSNQIQDLYIGKQLIYSVGFDDKLKFISLETNQYLDKEIKLDSQPRGLIVTKDEYIIITCYQHLIIIKDFEIISKEKVKYEGTCIAIGSDGYDEEEIAIGSKDKKVFIYEFKNGKMEIKENIDIIHRDSITSMAYSPDFKCLAVCDKNRRVIVYRRDLNYKLNSDIDWCAHQATVNCVSWSSNCKQLITGSLDTNVVIWNIDEPLKQIQLRKCHPMSSITNIYWKNNETIITTGHDSNIKILTFN